MVYKKNEKIKKPSNTGEENDSFELEDISRSIVRKESTDALSRSNKKLSRHSSESANEPQEGAVDLKMIPGENSLLNITVYRTDRLKVSPTISRLFVRVHIMDTETEDYLKISNNNGTLQENVVPILPIDTKVVNTKYQDLLIPVWDDVILIEQRFDKIASKKNSILFFEILDTAESIYGNNSSNHEISTERSINSFMVAWAFLRLRNSNGELNTGHRKQRLQLYEPIIKKSLNSIEKKLGSLPLGKVSTLSALQKNQLMKNNCPNISEYNSMESGYHLLSCWKSGNRYRVPYPSSLYVTVKSVNKTERTKNQMNEKSLHKMTKLSEQPPTLSMIDLNESGVPIINSISDNDEDATNVMNTEISELMELQNSWLRRSSQPCRIPNKLVGYGITTHMHLNSDNNDLSTDRTSKNQNLLPMTKSYGAQCLSFSPDGKWLAVGVIRHFMPSGTTGYYSDNKLNRMDCSILIYKFPFSGKRSQPTLELAGHSDIIYSLDWAKTPIFQNPNNKVDETSPRKISGDTKVFWILASGSADGTVRVWRLHLTKLYRKTVGEYIPVSYSDTKTTRELTSAPIQVGQIINGSSHKRGVLCNVLGHPNFVYSVVFKPTSTELDGQEFQNIQTLLNRAHLLATGCYDRNIRLWSIKHSQAQLLQELNGIHQSHINSLTFDKNGSHLYSGDASGLIVVWQKTNSQRNQVKSHSKWIFEKKIEVRELEMCVINHLEFHPTMNLLLVHTRDNCLKMLDLRSDFITTRFHGALNNTELLRSCISPCGTFIFSGSEDGNVYVWNVNTGDQVEIYQNLLLPGSVTSISYHPTDNVIAFSAVGPDSPVIVYAYDIKASKLSQPRSKDEIFQVQGEYEDSTEPPPDILTSHVKFKQRSAERILHAMSKLESVLNFSKPMTYSFDNQNNLHELEWRPTYTVIDETSNQRNLAKNFDSTSASQSQLHRSGGKANLFTVLYDYQAQRSDELSLNRGDIVKILYKDTPKWWMAKLIRTGQEGFIPASYVSEEFSGEVDASSRQTTSVNTGKQYNALGTNLNSQSQFPSDEINRSEMVQNNNLPPRYFNKVGSSNYDSVDSQTKPRTSSNSDEQSNATNLGLMRKRKSSARPLPTLS
ncbi:unnamed protein product [Trichobilharzia szidati]|nr:unnamed protein product [Trichobilharzia szidati]